MIVIIVTIVIIVRITRGQEIKHQLMTAISDQLRWKIYRKAKLSTVGKMCPTWHPTGESMWPRGKIIASDLVAPVTLATHDPVTCLSNPINNKLHLHLNNLLRDPQKPQLPTPITLDKPRPHNNRLNGLVMIVIIATTVIIVIITRDQ